VYGTFGVHPHNASEYSDEVEARMLDAMAHAKSVAVGEMGLDYHVMNSPRDVQLACFRRQLRWAVEVAQKPVVLHIRDAEADTRLVLEEVLAHRSHWRIHLHCFTGTREFASWALARFPNLFIGFTGCVTFPSATSLCDVVRDVPLQRLLLVRTLFSYHLGVSEFSLCLSFFFILV
jgi:TatD DNase family protein